MDVSGNGLLYRIDGNTQSRCAGNDREDVRHPNRCLAQPMGRSSHQFGHIGCLTVVLNQLHQDFGFGLERTTGVHIEEVRRFRTGTHHQSTKLRKRHPCILQHTDQQCRNGLVLDGVGQLFLCALAGGGTGAVSFGQTTSAADGGTAADGDRAGGCGWTRDG